MQQSTNSDGFWKIKKSKSKTFLTEYNLKLSNKFGCLPEEPDDYQEIEETEITVMRKLSKSSVKVKCQDQVSRSSVKLKCQDKVSRSSFKIKCQDQVSKSSDKIKGKVLISKEDDDADAQGSAPQGSGCIIGG